ncbi:glycerophosphodiester phosphodiesterase family protein [Patulibacter minatonensis]|uniref:glycerophosphodiester phosphodiesterase family protein n=1 Tax=Patulibacter minatonensis TaxID=298163 RepID=UPI0004B092CD|nr:glycerophosphodiester phosphodiesterase family protein [Patulibacter minatonensis]
MWRRLVILAVLGLLAVAPGASAASVPFSWTTARFLHQAHQGGEDEVPSNTMYGFATALGDGSDMLEIDVHRTKDGAIVVGHDDTVDRTTNGHGAVQDLTLAQLRGLDAAHWFVPGRSTVQGLPASSYPLRGVRTGARPAPAGFDAEDFRIPTLQEVMQAFPHVPLNIEIKGADQAEKFRVADALAHLLKDSPRRDLVIVSFDQASIDRFHARAPEIPVAAGVQAAVEFLLLGQELPPGTVALQLPFAFDPGSIGLKLPVVQDLPVDLNLAQRWVTDRAHGKGVAVHYWEVPENEAAYRQVLDVCGDGIMTTRPAAFESFLKTSKVPRMGGQGGAAGADGCPNPPASPAPGCRLRVAQLVAPRDGRIAVRLERWGDLRTACDATATLRSAGPAAVPGAAAKARRAARRHDRRARTLARRAASRDRAAAAARRAGRPAQARTASRAATTSRRQAAAARRAARSARRTAAAKPRVVPIAAGRLTAPAGRMGAIVELPLTAAGRALLTGTPDAPVRATVSATADESRLMTVRR